MGIRGLTTYINNNEHAFLQQFWLHDCCLIVDGNSLCAQLYRSLNSFSAFGGDYDKFAIRVRNFFKGLKKCNINPYVLLDGSYESRKIKTACARLRSKIYGASQLDPVTQSRLQIFPLLLREVFKEVITDMLIPSTVCEFEADDEIAAMARHLNCPVLSYDSDFYIYNVLYIPFNSLSSKPLPVDIDGVKTMVLECKIYTVKHMLANFEGLKEEVLPLLATLLGNDFVKKKIFNKFFSQLKLPKSKKKTNDQQRCIHGLFKWFQNETLDSAIVKIVGRLKKKQKDRILYIIKRSIDGYHSKDCRSLKYFGISEDETPKPDWQPSEGLHEQIQLLTTEDVENNETNSETEAVISDDTHSSREAVSSDDEPEILATENDNKESNNSILGLPEWVADGIRHNHIPKPYINLYTHHLYFCSPQAEDYSAADSLLPCLPILRYAYDLLTDFDKEHFVYISRENKTSYKRIYVINKIAISRPFDIPFNKLTVEQLHFCFQHLLKERLSNMDISLLDVLPTDFQLIFLSILLWVTYCEVPIGCVHSIIMTYTMMSGIEEKTGIIRSQCEIHNKLNKKNKEINVNPHVIEHDESTLFLNKHRLQYEECLLAASVLSKHFELDDKIKKRPKSYDRKIMHSFAQYQCCLMQINCMNTLCRSPYASTKYSKCFNGTFVYNTAVKLENQPDPKAFFEQYLKGATTVLLFYKSLCSIYEKCAEQMGLTNPRWTDKRRKKRTNKLEEEINNAIVRFDSEVFI